MFLAEQVKLARPALQNLDGLVQLIVLRGFRLSFGFGGSRLRSVVIVGDNIVSFVGHQHVRSYRGFLNRFPAG